MMAAEPVVMFHFWKSLMILVILVLGPCLCMLKPYNRQGGRIPQGDTPAEAKETTFEREWVGKYQRAHSQTEPKPNYGQNYDDLDWLRDYFRRSKERRERLNRGQTFPTPASVTTPGPDADLLSRTRMTSGSRTTSGYGKDSDKDYWWLRWPTKKPRQPDWYPDKPRQPDWYPDPVTPPSIPSWDDLVWTPPPIPTIDWDNFYNSEEDSDESSEIEDSDDGGLYINPLWVILPVVGLLSFLVSLASLACRRRLRRPGLRHLPHPARSPAAMNSSSRANSRGPSLFITIRSSESRQNLFSPADRCPSPQRELLIPSLFSAPSESESREEENLRTSPPAYDSCVDEGLPTYNDAVVVEPLDAENVTENDAVTSRPPSYSALMLMTGGVPPPTYGDVCGDSSGANTSATETAANKC